MSVTRDKLYEEVWAEPMAKVAVRYRISANYLARVCHHLNVPFPIVDLISRQCVSARDITVLIADSRRKAEYYSILKRTPLPRPARWREEGAKDESTVMIDTIQRFKGLESPVVIIWGLDTLDLSKHQELLYVGMSRAKSLLILVAHADTCAKISHGPVLAT